MFFFRSRMPRTVLQKGNIYRSQMENFREKTENVLTIIQQCL